MCGVNLPSDAHWCANADGGTTTAAREHAAVTWTTGQALKQAHRIRRVASEQLLDFAKR